LKDLPYLVYWFLEPPSDDLTKSVSLEPCSDLLSYEEGERLVKDPLPKSIQKKYICQEKLTEDEERIVIRLRRFMYAAKTKDRTLPFAVEPVSNQFTISWRDATVPTSP